MRGLSRLVLLIFIALFFTGFNINAQNGAFEVRFAVKSYDCEANKVILQVQIKTPDIEHAFLVGDANFRFDYNPLIANNPKIDREVNFSNQSPSSDINYEAQNLNGSTVGTVSLNVTYTGNGSGAKLVYYSWTTVADISFDIIDPMKCFDALWHDDKRFPVTGVNEVLLLGDGLFEQYKVPAAGTFENISLCLPTLCNNIIAVDDINATLKNTPVSGSITQNDNSTDGSKILKVLTTTTNGTLNINATGSYTYTPNNDFIGTDGITYQVCNSIGQCDTARLVISITDLPVKNTNNAPIAMNDMAIAFDNSTISGNVLSNDFDADNNTLKVNDTPLQDVKNGILFLVDDGYFVYAPYPGFVGRDTFTYQVCDNGTPSKCAEATVVVLVSEDKNGANNNPPFANDDAFSTDNETTLNANLALNDTDPNIGFLTFNTSPIINPAHGSVTISDIGTFTYTPTAGYQGSDQFRYSVCNDGTPSLCDTATVYLMVYPAPNQRPEVTVIPQTILKPSVLNFCLNITDPDASDTHSATLCNAANGTVTLSVNNTTHKLCVEYTPNTTFVGKDTICVIVCDNGTAQKCDTVHIPITVTEGDAPPAANDDYFTTAEDTPLNGSVATNDTDTDNGEKTYRILNTLANTEGVLVFNTNGTFVFTPTANYFGTVSVNYSVCDTSKLCDTALLQIKITPVNDRHIINTTSINVVYNQSKSQCFDIVDPDVSEQYTLAICKNVVHGNVSASTNNFTRKLCLTYQPDAGFLGVDSVCFIICDSNTPQYCDTVKVKFDVKSNNIPPFAMNDIGITLSGVVTQGNVLVNDFDSDLNTISMTTTPIVAPKNGNIVFTTNGTYTYTPNNNFVGTENISYKICDNGAPSFCDTGKLVIVVRSANNDATQKPVIIDDNAIVFNDVTTNINVKANDFETSNGDLNNLTIIGTPVGGTASVLPNGSIAFTPTTGFTGKSTILYQMCNINATPRCDTATINLEIFNAPTIGTNRAPYAIDDALKVYKNTATQSSVASNDIELDDSQVLTYSLITTPQHGTLTLNANGTYTYTPATDYIGSDYFTYKICDNGTSSLCDTATGRILVLNVPCTSLNIKVLLEGAFVSSTGKMRTTLNERGLLPGQTPVSSTAAATPSGQPFNITPWNYTGTETVSNYASTVVDWVLVSLRTDASINSTVVKTAALLHNDGRIELLTPCFTLPTNKQFYVVVEHRNHMGVMSPTALNITNNSLTYDFTAVNSFENTDPPSFGQKSVSGKWMMYAGDGQKDNAASNFDINYKDSQAWKVLNGIFDKYLNGDFNLDADVNFEDQILWKNNNGKFSGVQH